MSFSNQEIDPCADRSAGGIQNEIIDVCSAREHELQNLNTEREEKAGAYRFGESVELSEYKRQHDPDGDEHRDVSDDISLPALVSVRDKVERLQVELGREPVQLRVDQAESAFGHREVEDNDNAYVDQDNTGRIHRWIRCLSLIPNVFQVQDYIIEGEHCQMKYI